MTTNPWQAVHQDDDYAYTGDGYSGLSPAPPSPPSTPVTTRPTRAGTAAR